MRYSFDDFLYVIDEIVKYGLCPDIDEPNKEYNLVCNLLDLYRLYFKVDFVFDENDYPDYPDSDISHYAITENIRSNFSDFGFSKVFLELLDIENTDDIACCWAVDDLSGVITDLLEVKWRIENNSVDDGIWYFMHAFNVHTEYHVLNLLNYLKSKNWPEGLYITA